MDESGSLFCEICQVSVISDGRYKDLVKRDHAAQKHVHIVDKNIKGQVKRNWTQLDRLENGVYFTKFANFLVEAKDTEIVLLVDSNKKIPLGQYNILIAFTRNGYMIGPDQKEALLAKICSLCLPDF